MEKVYVIDNSTNFNILDLSAKLSLLNLDCYPHGENVGVASAQNVGIDLAAKDQMHYVLFLDQDSESGSQLIQHLLFSYQDLVSKGCKVSAIGPRTQDRMTRRLSSPLRFGFFGTRALPCPENGIVPVDFLISSGSLIPMEVLQKVGLMRGDLFIDYIDTEWIMRAHSMGYQAYLCCQATITHAIGEKRIRIWVGRWRNAPLHKPFRYYYLFRNYLLIFRDKGISPRWKFMELQRLIQMFFYVVLFSNERVLTVHYILQGIIDGLCNRGGKLRF